MTGLMPETVSTDRLQQANALMGLTRNVPRVLGPLVGGAVVALANPGWLFAIDSATFVLSAVFLALLGVRSAARVAVTPGFLAELAAGWRELTARSWLWTSVVYYSVANFAVAPVWVLGPLVASRELGGADDWGVIVACAGAGSIVGSAVALRFRPARPLFTGFLVLATVALVPASLISPLPTLVIAAAAIVGMAALSLSNAFWETALQEHVPKDALSRVSAYDWMGSLVFMPLGYAFAGLIATAVGIDATLWGMTAILAFSTLAVLAVPSVRRLGAKPPPPTGRVPADAGVATRERGPAAREVRASRP